MSESATQPASDSAAPGSDPEATAGEGSPAATPEGFVPLSEVEAAREEARRARQAAEDLRQELAKRSTSPKDAPAASETPGFDPDDFRQSLLRDVSGVISLSTMASAVKSEYPHADPALFDADRMAQFSSPDAFKQAVADSHARMAAILDTGWKEREEKLRAELAERYGDAGAGAGGGGTPGAGGDPTPAQLAQMSDADLDALEAREPGILTRIARSAGV